MVISDDNVPLRIDISTSLLQQQWQKKQTDQQIFFRKAFIEIEIKTTTMAEITALSSSKAISINLKIK